MNWQSAAALGIVAATAGLFGWTKLRRRKFSFQKQTHCGCAGAGVSPSGPTIVFHGRKGERPQVTLKPR